MTIIITFLVLVYSYNSSQKYNEAYLAREDFYSWRLERTEELLNYYQDKEGPMEANLKRDYEKYLEFKIAYENNDREKIANSMINEIMENRESAKGFMGYPDKGFALETIKINVDEMTSHIVFIKDGKFIEEDISKYQEDIYYFKVKKPNETVDRLDDAEITLKVDEIVVSTENYRLNEIIDKINKIDQIIDIRKEAKGAEKRYEELYNL